MSLSQITLSLSKIPNLENIFKAFERNLRNNSPIMEIVNANSASLCNFEVMKHLQKIKDTRKKHMGQLATITYETFRYLENTSCAHQETDSIARCLKALEPFNLNKNEKLMLINTPPLTALEIQLMIEESEERLSDDQVDQILEIIVEHFPKIQKAEEKTDSNQE